MKNIFIFTLYLLINFIFSIPTFSQNDYSNEILVYFTNGISFDKSTNGTVISDNSIMNTLNKFGIEMNNVTSVFPNFVESDTSKFDDEGNIIKLPNMSKIYKVTVHDKSIRTDIIAELNKLNNVLFAEPNGTTTPMETPDDEYFSNQWGLKNGTTGRDIHATQAWDIYKGNSNNIIAIIDGGIDKTHEDLQNKVSGGDNGYGWDGHGIHVAGIAAASTNNNTGIAGVDWYGKIHPQRVDNTDDQGTYNAVVDAVNHNSKVYVLNNSWSTLPAGRYSSTIRMAFAYAYKMNRVSVVAMGNNNGSQTQYPAGFGQGIIAVGATKSSDEWDDSYSNTGNHIDVSAPGTNIYSTYTGNGYYYDSGTSMATPHVSGIASLLKGYNTNLYNDDIEQIIRLSIDDVNSSTYPGWDEYLGTGRVNAKKALDHLRFPYALHHKSETGGSEHSHTSTFGMTMFGVPGLADGPYLVKRYDVRKTVYLGQSYLDNYIWGRGVGSIGYSNAPTIFGMGFCDIVSYNNSSATLRTYVYEVWDTRGRYIGWKPCEPSNVSFNYTVLGKLTPITSPSNKNKTSSAGNTTFTIENNGYSDGIQWNASDNADWASLSPTTGTIGNGQSQTLTVNCSANPNKTDRNCTITISCLDYSEEVTVTQYGKPTATGTLTSNENWRENVTLTGDLTVPEGITLTIQQGKTITFPDYCEMYVYGTLTAEGTSSNKITLESQSGTPNNSENAWLVRFNSNETTSNLEYCKFQNAYRGIYAYNSTPDIENCEIKNCYYGIYINNCDEEMNFNNNNINNCSYGIYNYYSNPQIKGNSLDYSSYGIYNYRSSPDIYSNDLDGGAFGIRCNSYSSPQLASQELSGYNLIQNNFMVGVYCEDNSNPYMGYAYCNHHGYNSLTNNTEGQVYAGTNCTVYAEENWWGSSSPSSGWFSGDVDYIPYLTSPPEMEKLRIDHYVETNPEEMEFDIAFADAGKNLDGGITMSFFDPKWNLKQKTRFAHSLIYNGDPVSAQTICKDIIANYPDSSLAFFALDLLWQASRQPNMTTGYNMAAFKTYLPTLANRQDNKLLYGSAALLLAGFEGEIGLTRIDNVFNNFRNTYLAETALFQKFMFYLNEKEDENEARNVLNTMDRLFPKSTYTMQAHHMLGDPVNWRENTFAKMSNSTLLEESITIPKQYNLIGAFPNPFNPETSIKYDLPRLSKVEVNVFNMLGQKVKNIFVDSQNAGTHDIIWNGRNNNGNRVPSGVYVVHFMAKSLEGKEEVYEKSYKVTLLK